MIDNLLTLKLNSPPTPHVVNKPTLSIFRQAIKFNGYYWSHFFKLLLVCETNFKKLAPSFENNKRALKDFGVHITEKIVQKRLNVIFCLLCILVCRSVRGDIVPFDPWLVATRRTKKGARLEF